MLYILGPVLTVVVIAILIAGTVSGRGALGVLFGPTPTITPWPTTTPAPAATITPQGTPLSTDTPAATAAPAVLGATQDAFTAHYGSPELRGSVPWYSFTTSDGSALQLCFCETLTGKDGADHVDILSFGPADGSSSSSLTVDQYTTLAKSFMPADAVYQSDIHDPDVGTLHVYRSAALAAIFPAGDFENTGPGGGLVPPGTFSVNCDNPAVVGCALRVGT